MWEIFVIMGNHHKILTRNVVIWIDSQIKEAIMNQNSLTGNIYHTLPDVAPIAMTSSPILLNRHKAWVNSPNYQMCSSCIMDTSDSGISFNRQGECDYCQNFKSSILPAWKYGQNRISEIEPLMAKIRKEGKNKDFDCIIGLSGGLDSSYTAYQAVKTFNLKPLLLHVDAGWNTDQAVDNISKLVDGLKLDLFTEVINWEEMKKMQLAFLKSQIPDQDIPQDTAFFSGLYKFARKYKIKYVLTGGNFSTECCREPDEWGAYPGIDRKLIRSVLTASATPALPTFPIVDIFEYRVLYRYLYNMQVIKPLNFIPYFKEQAEQELMREFGWRRFEHKHHESRFTRFYEDYWMPKKFGFEKRRAHLSSLIMTGQLSRQKALELMKGSVLSEEFYEKEMEFISNKLGISVDYLKELMMSENRTFRNYGNKSWFLSFGKYVTRLFGAEKRFFR
jgi:N-acetyl sugar amidotransferase